MALGTFDSSSGRLLSLRLTKPISAIFFCSLGFALLNGCGTPGIPLPPSLDLPKPVSDLQAVRKGEKVTLTWTIPSQTTDHLTIRRFGITRICRSVESSLRPVAGKDECANEVGRVPPPKASPETTRKGSPSPKAVGRYIDNLSANTTDSFGEFSYAVEVMNDRSRSAGLSNQARVPAAPTLLPPANFAAQVTADGVVLSWTPVSQPDQVSGLHYLYRIYRREENGKPSSLLAELPLGDTLTSRFVDHHFEWENKYFYHATVATVINSPNGRQTEVEGDDTPEVEVFTRDIFPPAVPTGLQAVFSNQNEQLAVDLIWDPNAESDLAGYNVFRHEGGGPVVKLNSDLVKAPAFHDLSVAAGKKYFYSVSAVDTRGNESSRSAEANETVP